VISVRYTLDGEVAMELQDANEFTIEDHHDFHLLRNDAI
jgi:hypothetical protein